jgi:ABC-type transport system involved in multi-copper enzyme maturation permease subunit
MSPNISLGSIVRSEWLKFRSVRSSIVGVVLTLVLTIGLAALVTWLIRRNWATTSVLTKATFDPVQTSLVGVILAQFAIGVIGALFVTSEYSSGSMRTTLTAVPKRVELMLGKLIVLIASIFVLSEFCCFVSFLLGQKIFSGVVPTASLSNSSDLRAVIFSGVYLTLFAALSFGLGIIIRHSGASICAIVGILLIVPLIFDFLPQNVREAGDKFLPSELGNVMSSPSLVSHDFGVWTSVILLVVYAVVSVGVGISLFTKRDA